MTSELKIDTGYLIFTKISFIYLYKVMLQSLQVMLQLLQVSMLDYCLLQDHSRPWESKAELAQAPADRARHQEDA